MEIAGIVWTICIVIVSYYMVKALRLEIAERKEKYSVRLSNTIRINFGEQSKKK